MWIKSYSTVTGKVTKEQMWKLWSDVNRWPVWDKSLETTHLEGEFKAGNFYIFQPKGSPKMKLKIHEAIKNHKFTDVTSFPLAKMYGEHVFEETPDGLKLTTTIKVVGILGFLWRKLVAQKIVDELPKDMAIQIEAAGTIQP
jgi:hypothetical protein